MLDGAIPFPAEFAARYRTAGYWSGERLDQIHARHLVETPSATAVLDDQRSLSYRQLENDVDALAAGLAGVGIRSRDRVLLQLPNRASFVVSALALMRIGAIPVYLLPAHRASELAAIAAQAEPVAYLGAAVHERFDHRELAREIKAKTPSLRLLIIDGETSGNDQIRLDQLTATGPSAHQLEAPRIAVASDDVAFLQLSGGTTGTPKLIPRTHDDYLYSVRRSVEICRFDAQTRLLLVLPAAHNFPMSSPGFLGALLAGGTVIMASSAAPDDAFDLIWEQRATVVPLVPPLALAWLSAAAGKRRALPDWRALDSLQTLQVGGAKLVPEAAGRIESELGVRLQQVFGMAEGLVCYTREGDGPEITETSQGSPMSPADEVLVVDDRDQAVPDGVVGQLLTRGPYTIRGYYKAPEHNARSFTADGFYRTGDLVRRLPGGQLQVSGRVKDQINRGGEKISVEEIENHLIAHPAVFDAALVAVPDEYLGERSCAVVVLDPSHPGSLPGKREILDFVRARGVAKHKIPDRIEFVDGFPATGVGKTSRAELRRVLADRFTPVAH